MVEAGPDIEYRANDNKNVTTSDVFLTRLTKTVLCFPSIVYRRNVYALLSAKTIARFLQSNTHR